MASSLTLENLVTAAGGKTLTQGLALRLGSARALAIVGPSGCGKTTLLTTLAGLTPAAGGRVLWDGHEGLAHSGVKTSFVWQGLGLLPWKRVLENLTLPLRLAGIGAKARREAGLELLEELGLAGLENRFPATLSGGQRQRLALGRALIAKPDVLFLDEPFSALDALLREKLQDFLTELRAAHPCTLVMVTHDIAEAVFLADTIVVLRPTGAWTVCENEAAGIGRESDRHYEAVKRIHALLRGDA